jgi:hypothetical protein
METGVRPRGAHGRRGTFCQPVGRR